jgi:hypothetical protein
MIELYRSFPQKRDPGRTSATALGPRLRGDER